VFLLSAMLLTATNTKKLTVDNSAVQVVSNVKVRMEAPHSIAVLSLHDLLWETYTFTTTNNTIISTTSTTVTEQIKL